MEIVSFWTQGIKKISNYRYFWQLYSEVCTTTDGPSRHRIQPSNNLANNFIRGSTLAESQTAGSQDLLWGPPGQWPALQMSRSQKFQISRKGMSSVPLSNPFLQTPAVTQFTDWLELVKATHQALNGAAVTDANTQKYELRNADLHLLHSCQADSFLEEVKALKASKPVSCHSQLKILAPDMDANPGLIRVGGCLRHINITSVEDIHPIILDCKWPITQLLIKAVMGLRWTVAPILGSPWQAIAKIRGQPAVPVMVDLPQACLQPVQPRVLLHRSGLLRTLHCKCWLSPWEMLGLIFNNYVHTSGSDQQRWDQCYWSSGVSSPVVAPSPRSCQTKGQISEGQKENWKRPLPWSLSYVKF